jgi:zinc transport system substrate-binding protein
MIPMLTHRTSFVRTAALLVVAPLLLAGCGSASGGGDAGAPRVAAAFYPLQYVAQRVAGEQTEVGSLTAPGVEPHDVELTVQQTADLAESEIGRAHV